MLQRSRGHGVRLFSSQGAVLYNKVRHANARVRHTVARQIQVDIRTEPSQPPPMLQIP